MTGNAACALVNNEQDLKEFLKANSKVIALFQTSWCPFCVSFLSIFKKHARREGLHFIIVQDDQEAMADQYSVEIYPTVLFFENGIVLTRLDGVSGVGLDEKQLIGFINSCSMS